jgi:signal recognition particle receptor subunit alpha
LQSLANFSASVADPRTIDGLVLSKFDTVDDKVCCVFFCMKVCLLSGVYLLEYCTALFLLCAHWSFSSQVGAAVSMVHKTGLPIVFVGTGQKYTHLRKLNVKTVVKALFS